MTAHKVSIQQAFYDVLTQESFDKKLTYHKMDAFKDAHWHILDKVITEHVKA
ncbi:hypothetical protein [Vibrio cholerae]|uniref:hypothetical protein n=1 Tax=Vibrio cholerae TaxID=666 RepID=UPI001A2B20ED|nr:hypothetical protein [Vibrio cholerae]HAS3611745.1 hypothetical protein [Vibrio cholerae]